MSEHTTSWTAPGEPPAPATPNTHGPVPPGPPAPPPPGAPAPGWWRASDGRWYPPQQAATYQVGYGVPAAPSTNGMAIAALVLGILWLYWIGSILALVFGYVAKRQIDDARGTQQGRGMAGAGIVLGWIGVGLFALFFFLGILAASA